MEFTVHGTPATKGSTTAVMQFTRRRGWRARVLPANKRTAPWQTLVRDGAAQARARDLASSAIVYPRPIGVHVRLGFVLPRPMRAARGALPTTQRGDIDKLVRTVLDALTGVVYADDAQVVRVDAGKRYASTGEPTGVYVCVWSDGEFAPPLEVR